MQAQEDRKQEGEVGVFMYQKSKHLIMNSRLIIPDLDFLPGIWTTAGTGGPRGATPHSRSGGAAVRRYPSFKVRSSGCALLEQP